MLVSVCPTGEHGVSHGTFCPRCGRKLVEAEYGNEPSHAVEMVRGISAKCPECGTPYDEWYTRGRPNHNHCTGCGGWIQWVRKGELNR